MLKVSLILTNPQKIITNSVVLVSLGTLVLRQPHFQPQPTSDFSEKAPLKAVRFMSITKGQTDKASG